MNDNKNVKIIENDGDILELSLDILKLEALNFCKYQENIEIPELYNTTDGKAVGTYIEREFKKYLENKYSFSYGNAAKGIDLPGEGIMTDIKVTSAKQPQSSSPFKSATQKIYGLGYNLLLFVYNKFDDYEKKSAKFQFVSCAFISKERTGDFQTTKMINEILERNGNEEDLFAFFEDRKIPGDDITYTSLAEEVLRNPPIQGYLTISNALQWRLQYKRIVDLKERVEGIDKII